VSTCNAAQLSRHFGSLAEVSATLLKCLESGEFSIADTSAILPKCLALAAKVFQSGSVLI